MVLIILRMLVAKNEKTALELLPALANRHGLITGATGTGKTLTMQAIAQRLSDIGVPVFMADVKGDFSGIARPGGGNPKVVERLKSLGVDAAFAGCPVEFWDVYAKCEELGWSIFLHPVDTLGQDRTRKYYLKNLCGNPYDTGVAVAHLIFGGVMDEFRKLSFNLPHAGGTFPWLIGRWDRGAKVRPELKHMKRAPSRYLRRFTYDAIGHDDRINAALVKLVGADRVTLGSDYCFDMGLDDPLAVVGRIKAISAREKQLISGGNASKLLRL